MTMILGRLQVPQSARRGEPFEVRVLVQHQMETGFRRDLNGGVIALNIVNKLACRYGGREVFSAELGSGISANPYLAFYVLAGEGGEIAVEWSDDHGERGSATAMVNVT